jgi:hypothetical protein
MRRKVILIAISLAMLLFSVLSWLKEEIRPWKRYQARYHELMKSRLREEAIRISRPERSPLERKIERVAEGERLIIQFRNAQGRSERCLTCHLGLEEISPNHPVERVGCIACHGGDPLALDGKAAHRKLIGSDRLSCGGTRCHGAITESFKHMSVQRCAECHYDLSDSGRYEGGDVAMVEARKGSGKSHTLTTAIPSSRCMRCHKPLSEEHRQTPRCVIELGCINCHTGKEVMLGAKRNITCSTCHSPSFEAITSEDDPAVRFSNLNPFISNRVGEVMAVDESGEKLNNVKRIGSRIILIDKSTGKRYEVPEESEMRD